LERKLFEKSLTKTFTLGAVSYGGKSKYRSSVTLAEKSLTTGVPPDPH
jgi:hypothetical protein